jgi:hypothetical protein
MTLKLTIMRATAILFVASAFTINLAQAQDEVSDDQLYKFAIIEETKSLFASELSAQITEYVEKQDAEIKNRYNALAGGEEPANEAESKFIQMVNKMKSDRTAEYSDAYKSLVKRLMGASDYKKVKTSIASDARVRARYSEMVEGIRDAKAESDASASTGE